MSTYIDAYINGSHPSLSEQISCMISGKSPESSAKTDVHPVLIRVPLNDLLHLDAMAQLAQKSRNQMGVLLLRAGIDAVFEKSDADTKQRVKSCILGIKYLQDETDVEPDEIQGMED